MYSTTLSIYCYWPCVASTMTVALALSKISLHYPLLLLVSIRCSSCPLFLSHSTHPIYLNQLLISCSAKRCTLPKTNWAAPRSCTLTVWRTKVRNNIIIFMFMYVCATLCECAVLLLLQCWQQRKMSKYDPSSSSVLQEYYKIISTSTHLPILLTSHPSSNIILTLRILFYFL